MNAKDARKLPCAALAIFVAVSFLIAACSSPGSAPTTVDKTGWPKSVATIGGTPGTTVYTLNSAVAMITNKYLGLQSAPLAVPGGTQFMIEALMRNEGEISVGDNFTATAAYEGKDPFKTPQDVRAIAQGFDMGMATFAIQASGIKTMMDLKGRKLIATKGGMVNQAHLAAILDAYKLDAAKDNITLLPIEGTQQVIDDLRNGKADAGNSAILDSAPLKELALTKPVQMVPWDEDKLAYMIQKEPRWSRHVIPANTYKGTDKDTITLGYFFYVTTRKDMPESFVYEVTKAIYKNIDEFRAFAPICKQFDVKLAKEVNIPHHAGAVKFYKEIGAWTPEMDAKYKSRLAAMKQDK